MTTLVLGGAGLLGSSVLVAASRRDAGPVGAYHTTAPDVEAPVHRVDVCEREDVTELLDEYDPDLVVNCAAMTDVDECERRPGVARAVNAEAPGHVARDCAERDIAFTHTSTDYVFEGEAETPYATDESPNPV